MTRAYNLSTFTTTTGLTPGIQMRVGRHNTKTGKQLSPYLRVGPQFIQVDQVWQPPLTDDDCLCNASLKLITPRTGTSFEVWVPRNETDRTQYVLFTTAVPAGEQPHALTALVQATREVEGTEIGSCLVRHHQASECYLLSFTAPEGTVYVYTGDGSVYHLYRRDEVVQVRQCSAAEAAVIRVDLYAERIASDAYAYATILDEVVRLLRYSTDTSALSTYAEFLETHRYHLQMTTEQRAQVYDVLSQYKLPVAAMFAPPRRMVIVMTKRKVITIQRPIVTVPRAPRRTGS